MNNQDRMIFGSIISCGSINKRKCTRSFWAEAMLLLERYPGLLTIKDNVIDVTQDGAFIGIDWLNRLTAKHIQYFPDKPHRRFFDYYDRNTNELMEKENAI